MILTAANAAAADTDTRPPWFAFAVLLALFWFGEGYVLFYKAGTLGNERDAAMLIAAGSARRGLAFVALGAFGALAWFLRPRSVRASIHGWLPALVTVLIAYVSLSVIWAEDQNLVLKRIVTFLLFCIAAFGFAYRFSNRDLVMFAFVAGAFITLTGLASELSLGTFKPWQTDFRFYGILHANNLGAVLAIFILAALTLARTSPERCRRYLAAAVIAFGFLILTKSRTSFGAAIAGSWVFLLLSADDRRRFIGLSVLGLALIGPVLAFALGDMLDDTLQNAALLGRQTESPETFTGRLPLWEGLISRYVDERPLFGYGFHGFWTPRHVVAISAIHDWLILHAHSEYVGIMLDLGYVGLGLFILVLAAGMARALAYYRASGDYTWLFMLALLVWAAVGAGFEIVVLNPTLRSFICMVVLAKLALFDPRGRRAPMPAYA